MDKSEFTELVVDLGDIKVFEMKHDPCSQVPKRIIKYKDKASGWFFDIHHGAKDIAISCSKLVSGIRGNFSGRFLVKVVEGEWLGFHCHVYYNDEIIHVINPYNEDYARKTAEIVNWVINLAQEEMDEYNRIRSTPKPKTDLSL